MQIVSKKLTKMHTHLCIDIRVVLLFVNRTGKLVEMSADETGYFLARIFACFYAWIIELDLKNRINLMSAHINVLYTIG